MRQFDDIFQTAGGQAARAHRSARPFDPERGAIAPIEEIIEDAASGKPFILVDAEDRENEGDLIVPADAATSARINFMARFGRGLVCLAITRDRADALELEPMASTNRCEFGTAFTVSIDAREGVTTGISAFDRARTVATAIDPLCGAADLITPGHMFPLVARDGGVLERAGHTEAAVDIARLAGRNPSGVICEIMNDDGTMARLPDLIVFARRHGLKIGTIEDLVAYRRRNDPVAPVAPRLSLVTRRDRISPVPAFPDVREAAR